MKKLFLIFLILFFPSYIYSAGVVTWSTSSKSDGSKQCTINFTAYTQTDPCVWNPSSGGATTCVFGGACSPSPFTSDGGSGCTNVSVMSCSIFNAWPAPPGGCNIQNYTNSVGGCGGSPIYCSTSSVYQKVNDFLGVIDNASRWSYFSTIGPDNNIYKCVLSYTRSTGQTVLVIAGTAISKHNPVGSRNCLNQEQFNALLNTNCSLTSGWAVNSGYATNYNTGEATQDTSKTEGPIAPPNSPVSGPTGQPITSPTGFDGNGDGFDDITGQPLPFSPSSTTGVKDTDGDGIGEVEITDPSPESIPGVPSQGELDTSVESPEAKPLSGLFDILDSSPFVSLLQGTRMTLSGSTCSLSTSAPVFGNTVTLDFCSSAVTNVLTYLGYIIVGIAAILALLIIFV